MVEAKESLDKPVVRAVLEGDPAGSLERLLMAEAAVPDPPLAVC